MGKDPVKIKTTLNRASNKHHADFLAPPKQNNWNSLGCEVSESLLLDTSAKLVSLGLRDIGYNYVVLDDCWSDGRNPDDDWLREDLVKFPSGMKRVADKIHDLGLLFGMYSSAGEMTCARFGKLCLYICSHGS